MCPKSGKRCSGNCGNGLSGSIGKLRTADGDWYTPENLDDLLAVLSHLPQGCKYRLVAGNTGTGRSAHVFHTSVQFCLHPFSALMCHGCYFGCVDDDIKIILSEDGSEP